MAKEEITLSKAKELMRTYIKKLNDSNNKMVAKYFEEIQEKFLSEYAKLSQTRQAIRGVAELPQDSYIRGDKSDVRAVNRIIKRQKESLDKAQDNARSIAEKYIEIGKTIANSAQYKDPQSFGRAISRKVKALESEIRRLNAETQRAETQQEKLGDLVAKKIPILKEFGNNSVAEAYNKEKKGNTFLKGFFSRDSRKEQISKIQGAIDKFASSMTTIAQLDPDKILIKSSDGMYTDAFSKITKDGPGKVALEELKETLGEVIQELEKEKKDNPYKLGESRLESICDKICASIRCSRDELVSKVEAKAKAEEPTASRPTRPNTK